MWGDDGWNKGWMDGWMDEWIYRWTDRQIERQTDRQTEKLTAAFAETLPHVLFISCVWWTGAEPFVGARTSGARTSEVQSMHAVQSSAMQCNLSVVKCKFSALKYNPSAMHQVQVPSKTSTFKSKCSAITWRQVLFKCRQVQVPPNASAVQSSASAIKLQVQCIQVQVPSNASAVKCKYSTI